MLSRDPVALDERMLPQPTARRTAVMLNPEDPMTIPQAKEAERAAPSIRLEVRFFHVHAIGELGSVFERAWKCGASPRIRSRASCAMPGAVPSVSARVVATITQVAHFQMGRGAITFSAGNAPALRAVDDVSHEAASRTFEDVAEGVIDPYSAAETILARPDLLQSP